MGLRAGTANPNPGRTPHKPALPATQPRAPPTKLSLSPSNRQTETRSPAEKTLLNKAMGRGGRKRKALKM